MPTRWSRDLMRHTRVGLERTHQHARPSTSHAPPSGRRSRMCVSHGRQQLAASQRLQVACTAIEPDTDTEVASTSGRSLRDPYRLAADSELQHMLHGQAPQEQEMTPRRNINRKLKAADTLPLLLDVIRAEGPDFDHANTTHALTRLSKLHRAYFTTLHASHLCSDEARDAAYAEYVEPALRLLNGLVLRHSPDFEPWDVAMCLWACGNMGRADPGVLQRLCERVQQACPQFKPIDSASALLGLAKLGVRRPEVLEPLAAQVLHSLSQFQDWRPQELANVVYAFGKLRYNPGKIVLNGLMDGVVWRMEDFTTQELNNILWSFARLKWRHKPLLQLIANRLAACIAHLNPQDVGNMMWSFAVLDYKPGPKLLDNLPYHVLKRLGQYRPQEVCNLLYGYGCLRHQHITLLDGVAAASGPRMHEFSTQDFSLTLWTYGVFRRCPSDARFRAAVANYVTNRGHHFRPTNWAVVIKALGRMGFPAEPLLRAQISQAVATKLRRFSVRELSYVLQGLVLLSRDNSGNSSSNGSSSSNSSSSVNGSSSNTDMALVRAIVGQVQAMLQTGIGSVHKLTLDTVVFWCQELDYMPWALVELAELRGYRVSYRQHLLPPVPSASTSSADGDEATWAAAGNAEEEAGAYDTGLSTARAPDRSAAVYRPTMPRRQQMSGPSQQYWTPGEREENFDRPPPPNFER